MTNFQHPLGLFIPGIFKKIGSFNFSHSYGGPPWARKGASGGRSFDNVKNHMCTSKHTGHDYFIIEAQIELTIVFYMLSTISECNMKSMCQIFLILLMCSFALTKFMTFTTSANDVLLYSIVTLLGRLPISTTKLSA